MSIDDLARPPTDPVAAQGYVELHRLWRTNYDAFAEGREISSADFAIWLRDVHALLTPREARFLLNPFEPAVAKIPEWMQAKTGGRVYKILLDRRGFKVSIEVGGLG